MPTRMLFLRGINVGGVRVGMPELRETLTVLGATDVRTWLATGNVRLEWAGSDEALKADVEAALTERFHYSAHVLVRQPDEVATLVRECPFATDPTMHRYVVFGGACAWEEVAASLPSEPIPQREWAQPSGEELWWRCPKGATTSSPTAKILARRTYASRVTTRNLTTLEKMLG